MRLISPLLLILCFTACQRGGQNNTEAVRQGVLDHFAKAGGKTQLNVSAMDVVVKSVQFNGDQADVDVTVTPKGTTGSIAMPFRYHMERQNNKWVVVGSPAGGHGEVADPNAGGMPPAGAENPHGGAMPPAGGAGKMPSPQDLPPAKKK